MSAAGTAGSDSTARRLLVLDAAYTLSAVRQRGLEHAVTSRDLDGYFDHVWSVHPLVGASPEDEDHACGAPSSTWLAPRHTVVEGHIGRSRRLRRIPPLNLALAQLELLWRLHRLIRQENVSVVRAGDPYYLGLLGLMLARVNRIPLVIRVNGNYDAIYAAVGRLAYPRIFRWRWVEKRVERFVLRRAALVAGANEDNLAFAIANGARRERSTVFRYGNLIHPAHFSDPAARRQLDVGDLPTPLFLIAVTRLEPVKHPEDILDVLQLVREHHPGMTAVLVGDGSARGALEQRARDLGVEEAVLFAGNRDQEWIAVAMASAAVVVAPMAGRALVEAALSGTPIVAYDVEWHAELVTDGGTGILVPHRDVAAMADAVVELLDDQERAAALGDAARAAAADAMDPHKLAGHERAHYDAVFGRTPWPVTT